MLFHCDVVHCWKNSVEQKVKPNEDQVHYFERLAKEKGNEENQLGSVLCSEKEITVQAEDPADQQLPEDA